MSPAPSIAMLPIQRYVASGAYVPCWNTLAAPVGLRSSYQRTPTEVPAVTAWLTTSASWSPKFRYARRYISRSASESSFCVTPGCGMQVPPPLHAALNGATAIDVGPVKVVLAEFDQSTWNFQRFSALVPKLMNGFGAPTGGGFVPSRSDGRRPPYAVLSWKHCCVADVSPARSFARSSAHTLLPAKVLPLLKML